MEEKLDLIFKQLKLEVLSALDQAKENTNASTASTSTWLTAEQLAEHWGLVNADGKPKTAGIMNWTKREQHPLPHGRLGDLIKFDRTDADRWAKEEALRLYKAKNPKNS